MPQCVGGKTRNNVFSINIQFTCTSLVQTSIVKLVISRKFCNKKNLEFSTVIVEISEKLFPRTYPTKVLTNWNWSHCYRRPNCLVFKGESLDVIHWALTCREWSITSWWYRGWARTPWSSRRWSINPRLCRGHLRVFWLENEKYFVKTTECNVIYTSVQFSRFFFHVRCQINFT